MALGCRTCGTLNPDRATVCEYCGASLPSTPLYGHDPFRSRRQERREVVPSMAQTPPRPMYPAYPPAGAYAPAPKDPSTGLLIELIPGFFGVLGVGYLWAGELALGLALLLGYWFFWGAVMVATFLTFGLLLCFFPFFILLYFAAPIVSALALQRRLRARQLPPLVARAPYPY
jgi:hypothetical protein